MLQLRTSRFVTANSASLKMAQHRKPRFLKKQWILFRGINGHAGLIARYCRHMGVDLNEGSVVKNTMVCQLHLWPYSREEAWLADIPPDKPRAACLTTLTIQEWAGIIFVFSAKAAAYKLPRNLVSYGAALIKISI